MASKQRGSRVSDQKQEVKEEQMSKQATMVLMKNLLRISISSICFSRQLFHDDCFKTKDYAGMGLKVLDVTSVSGGVVMTNNVEAFRLQNWLERGVFPALELEFVDTVKFGVFTRHPKTGRDMNIESYEFKLQYADEHKKAEVNGIELSKESIRTQAQRFLRSLIEFSKTLDDIPESRWLTIALKYNKNAPKDYEPDQFEGTSATVFNMSMENPLKFDFKQVITPHINLNVAFEGRESLKMKDLGAVELLRDLAGGEEPLDHRGIDVSSYFFATAYANEVCTETAVETLPEPEDVFASQSQEEEMQFSQKKNLTGVSFADPPAAVLSQDDSLCNTLSQQGPPAGESVMAAIRERIESFLRCSSKGETKSECSKHLTQFELIAGFRDRQNAVTHCLDRLVVDGLAKKTSNSKYVLFENLPPAKASKQSSTGHLVKKKRGGVDPGLLLPPVSSSHPLAPPNSINAENWNPNVSQLTESHCADNSNESSDFVHEPPRKRRAIISDAICLQKGVNDFPSTIATSQVP